MKQSLVFGSLALFFATTGCILEERPANTTPPAGSAAAPEGTPTSAAPAPAPNGTVAAPATVAPVVEKAPLPREPPKKVPQ